MIIPLVYKRTWDFIFFAYNRFYIRFLKVIPKSPRLNILLKISNSSNVSSVAFCKRSLFTVLYNSQENLNTCVSFLDCAAGNIFAALSSLFHSLFINVTSFLMSVLLYHSSKIIKSVFDKGYQNLTKEIYYK